MLKGPAVFSSNEVTIARARSSGPTKEEPAFSSASSDLNAKTLPWAQRGYNISRYWSPLPLPPGPKSRAIRSGTPTPRPGFGSSIVISDTHNRFSRYYTSKQEKLGDSQSRVLEGLRIPTGCSYKQNFLSSNCPAGAPYRRCLLSRNGFRFILRVDADVSPRPRPRHHARIPETQIGWPVS